MGKKYIEIYTFFENLSFVVFFKRKKKQNKEIKKIQKFYILLVI